MIVCQACGTSNADNERFCGQCGAFLEWEGAVVDRDAGTTTGGSADPGGTTSGTSGPEPSDGASTTGEVPAGGSSTVAEAPEVGVPTVARAAADGPSTVAKAPADRPSTVAKAPAGGSSTVVTEAPAAKPAVSGPVMAVQPGEAAPKEVGPTEVRPGEAQRSRPAQQRPAMQREAPRPGDLICGQCGTGNDPVRRFCRFCGELLADATPVHVPWWRRLWQWLTRRNRYEAGQRRQRRVRPHVGMVVKLLILLVIVALAVGFGPGLVRRVMNEMRDRTGDHVPITPNGFAASSARSGAGAQQIGDGASNRYWSPTDAGVDAWVEATFAQPVRLLDIVVTPGISLRQEEFLTTGRPRELVVLATPKTGTEKSFVLNLRDAPGAQTFAIEAGNVVRVRITVRSAYGPADKAGVAVAEVEFFGRL